MSSKQRESSIIHTLTIKSSRDRQIKTLQTSQEPTHINLTTATVKSSWQIFLLKCSRLAKYAVTDPSDGSLILGRPGVTNLLSPFKEHKVSLTISFSPKKHGGRGKLLLPLPLPSLLFSNRFLGAYNCFPHYCTRRCRMMPRWSTGRFPPYHLLTAMYQGAHPCRHDHSSEHNTYPSISLGRWTGPCTREGVWLSGKIPLISFAPI